MKTHKHENPLVGPPVDVEPAAAAASQIVGAIDIGSNLIRLVIAEVFPDQRVNVIEQLQRPVRLGQDTFRRGRLGADTMRAAVAILRDFRRVRDLYKVKYFRVVATSSVREAENADTLIDRVAITTDMDIEVIDTSEESRLMVSAVRQSMASVLEKKNHHILMVEVGGGSTLLTLLHGSDILNTISLPLGSIRLLESLAISYESTEHAMEILTSRINNEITEAVHMLPLKKIRTVVAIGGEARLAAKLAGRPLPEAEGWLLSRQAFRKFARHCQEHTCEELANQYGVNFTDTETLHPALLVFEALLSRTSASQMLVSPISMWKGLTLDLARQITGREDESLSEGILHSAMALARKYHVHTGHAEHVADLALRLFDELKNEHALTAHHRLLLHVAALLHEVGDFVGSRSHHKHSFYLIANSEIYGLSHQEVMTVALVARYHRRSAPKSTHPEYTALPREQRMEISKLAAILRVADALDVSHARQVRQPRFERQGEDLVIYVPQVADLNLERRGLSAKGDMLEDIYGIKLRLEEELFSVPKRPSDSL